MAVRKIWSIGERICRNDFKRRWILLFKYLMQSVMSYGIEIWDCGKKRFQKKYNVGLLCEVDF